MALDPSVPNDVKKKVPSAYGAGQTVRDAVLRSATAANNFGADVGDTLRQGYGYADNALRGLVGAQPADYSGTPVRDAAVRAGLATPPSPVNTAAVRTRALPAPTADAVNAGPPTATPIVNDGTKGSPVVAPPSPLDANAPLPAGVRLYRGTPGSNDAIYETRGEHGERAFSNNQFNPLGKAPSALDPRTAGLAALRSGEIQSSVNAQTAAANAAAGAAAIAPKNAAEYNDRLRVQGELAQIPGKVTAQTLTNVGKAGENLNNDPTAKLTAATREDLVKAGVNPAIAQERAQTVAAQSYLNSGLDPSASNAPPDARAGSAAAKRALAGFINDRSRAAADQLTNYIPFNHEGLISDADALDPSQFDIQHGITGTFLHGPADSKTGFRKAVLLSPEEEAQFAPYIYASKRRKALISDRK